MNSRLSTHIPKRIRRVGPFLLLANVLFFTIPFGSAATLTSQREFRCGLLAHSTGPISSGDESGADLNLEVLLAPVPNRSAWFGRTAIGASINNHGDTSQLYTARAWRAELPMALEFDYQFGISIHDGHLDDSADDRRQFGSRVLIRQSFELGYRHHNFRLSAIYSHASHLGLLAERNQGLDNLGMRLSLPF